MKKNGLSHIEMIISFVLFIGFVSAGLVFFNPTRGNQLVSSSLSYTFRAIDMNTSVFISVYGIKIQHKQTKPIEITGLLNTNDERNIAVKNYSGSTIPSKKVGYDVLVSSTNWSRDSFIVVNIASGINPYKDYPESGHANPGKGYVIASTQTIQALSENYLLALNASYYENYSELKKEFNLPAMIDFSFIVTLPSGKTITTQRAIPTGLPVYAQTKQYNIISGNGSIGQGKVIVKVW